MNELENEIDDGTRMHGAISGFTSLSADPDIDQAVGQSSGEVLLQSCLLYMDNVEHLRLTGEQVMLSDNPGIADVKQVVQVVQGSLRLYRPCHLLETYSRRGDV